MDILTYENHVIDYTTYRHPFFAKFTKEKQEQLLANSPELIKAIAALPLNWEHRDFIMALSAMSVPLDKKDTNLIEAIYLYIKKYEYFLSMYSPEYKRNFQKAVNEKLNFVPFTKNEASSKLAAYSFEQIINIFIKDKVFHKGFKDAAMWLLEDAIDFMLFFGRIRIVDAEEQKGNLYRDFQVEDRRDPII